MLAVLEFLISVLRNQRNFNFQHKMLKLPSVGYTNIFPVLTSSS